jgi:hypothetical protein
MVHNHDGSGYQPGFKQEQNDKNLLNIFKISLSQDLGLRHLEDFSMRDQNIEKSFNNQSLIPCFAAINQCQDKKPVYAKVITHDTYYKLLLNLISGNKTISHRGPPF